MKLFKPSLAAVSAGFIMSVVAFANATATDPYQAQIVVQDAAVQDAVVLAGDLVQAQPLN